MASWVSRHGRGRGRDGEVVVAIVRAVGGERMVEERIDGEHERGRAIRIVDGLPGVGHVR